MSLTPPNAVEFVPGPTPISAEALKSLSLWEIAAVIKADWKKVYFGAVPYLDALSTLDKVTDKYGLDDGKYIVVYFLSNATTWRGPVAKAVKAELKKRAALK